MEFSKDNKDQNNSPFGDDALLKDLSFGPSWTTQNFEPKGHEKRESKGKGGSGDRRGFKKGHFKGERQDRGERRDRKDGFKKGGKRFDKNKPAVFKPVVKVDLYPEDETFNLITKAMKTSCRTHELFEIAKLVIEKNERFVVVVSAFDKAPQKTFQICPLDGAPFTSEQEAVVYTLRTHVDKFFETEEYEVEAPKGTFPLVHRCGFTKELIGPPNYHRYPELLKQHYENHLSHMAYDKFTSRLESTKEQDDIDAWTEKMKKGVKYKLLAEFAQETEQVFERWSEARGYLITHFKDRLSKEVNNPRFNGALASQLPNGNMKRSIEMHIAKQREFPLNTANNLRGRLRRQGFAIYKKGTEGVTFTCAVKRKFREPGQKFAESLQSLVDFIEANPMVTVADLPEKYLGIKVPEVKEEQPKADEAPAPLASEQPAEEITEASDAEPVVLDAEKPADVAAETNSMEELSDDEKAKVRQLKLDLRWLIAEGYVAEFSEGGTLFAAPPQEPQIPKQQKEAAEKLKEEVAAETITEAAKENEVPVAEDKAKKVAPEVSEPVEEVVAEKPTA